MREYRTVQIDAVVATRLKTFCESNNWTMGGVVKRLVERFLDGHFSGSHADVIREDATPEYVLPGRIIGESNEPQADGTAIRTILCEVK